MFWQCFCNVKIKDWTMPIKLLRPESERKIQQRKYCVTTVQLSASHTHAHRHSSLPDSRNAVKEKRSELFPAVQLLTTVTRTTIKQSVCLCGCVNLCWMQVYSLGHMFGCASLANCKNTSQKKALLTIIGIQTN